MTAVCLFDAVCSCRKAQYKSPCGLEKEQVLRHASAPRLRPLGQEDGKMPSSPLALPDQDGVDLRTPCAMDYPRSAPREPRGLPSHL